MCVSLKTFITNISRVFKKILTEQCCFLLALIEKYFLFSARGEQRWKGNMFHCWLLEKGDKNIVKIPVWTAWCSWSIMKTAWCSQLLCLGTAKNTYPSAQGTKQGTTFYYVLGKCKECKLFPSVEFDGCLGKNSNNPIWFVNEIQSGRKIEA